MDDKEAVQLIPFNRNAWHAGDGNGAGNRQSIGIEICYSIDNGYSGTKSARYKKAEDNAALYIAHVLKQYGWGIDRLKRHYDWSRKDCHTKCTLLIAIKRLDVRCNDI
ncbi:N-acetylmuramoyl-L-alanine amidase family protein [Nosocomiicoccus ampullae]|uniref:peptidoglycan recognition protein family protein n=1 Tax=Nosocomiicoccus ampullae TaxID=489910 RepID=UPI003B83246B